MPIRTSDSMLRGDQNETDPVSSLQRPGNSSMSLKPSTLNEVGLDSSIEICRLEVMFRDWPLLTK